MENRQPPYRNTNVIVVISCVFPGCTQMFAETHYFSSYTHALKMKATRHGWRFVKHPNGYSDGMVCPGHVKEYTKAQLVKFKKPRKKKVKNG